jgi:Holliday junction resolvase RusA-like endonuclease
MTLRAWVPGNPKTKGSMESQERRGGGRRMVQSVEGSDEWALKITRAVQLLLATEPTPYRGAVMVQLAFWLPVADAAAGRCGDVDKLERNVLDALTKAGVYGDDVQVTHSPSFKYPVGAGGVQQAGVLIVVEPVDPLAFVEAFAAQVHDERRRMGLTT